MVDRSLHLLRPRASSWHRIDGRRLSKSTSRVERLHAGIREARGGHLAAMDAFHLEFRWCEATTGIWLQADLRHKVRGFGADAWRQHPEDSALEVHGISQDLGGSGDAYSLRGGGVEG